MARNARQVSRSLDALVQDAKQLDDGLELSALGNKDATGRLMFQTTAIHSTLPSDLPMGKADNQILGVVRALQEKYPQREVVLVSKDINMRLKARALGMAAEDYYNDHVLEDSDLMYSGVMQLPEDFWNKHGKNVESWQQGGTTFYRIHGPLCAQFVVNQFVYFEGQMPLYAQVREVSGKTAVLATLRDYTHGKNNVWGITARNREQNFAMNLLMNPECDFVSLLGQAGTGKTLLALAAGITQVLETKRYTEIIMTRVTVPVGEDIGFLPGTEEEKMLPWMGALEDNLDVLNMGEGEGNGDWGGRHHGPDPLAHQGQVAELHARPHLPQQVPHHRRGAEPDAQADEDARHARRSRHQGDLSGQHRPDRHALPHRGQLGPDLRGRPLQGLAARGPRHAAARRALAAGGLRGRRALTWRSVWQQKPLDPLKGL